VYHTRFLNVMATLMIIFGALAVVMGVYCIIYVDQMNIAMLFPEINANTLYLIFGLTLTQGLCKLWAGIRGKQAVRDRAKAKAAIVLSLIACAAIAAESIATGIFNGSINSGTIGRMLIGFVIPVVFIIAAVPGKEGAEPKENRMEERKPESLPAQSGEEKTAEADPNPFEPDGN
jgi:hypothetical protein